MVSIAIDGPSGAGKSSLAKALAKDLGYVYVDTGAMYRSIGLYAVRAFSGTTHKHVAAVKLRAGHTRPLPGGLPINGLPP